MRYFLLILGVMTLLGCGEREYANTRVVKPNIPAPEPVAETKNPLIVDLIPAKSAPNKLIANPIIEKTISKRINKPTGELTEADYQKITRLSLSNNQLTDVKGLEKLTKLTKLYLYGNHLTDVSGLEKLPELTWLELGGNQLADIPKGLEKLTQLKVLWLSDNKLTDVSDLEKLPQLMNLYLNNNELTDVKGLEKLTQLTGLVLSDNKLTDVNNLEKLEQLTGLVLNNNPDLTKAQISELKKALPKCKILSNPTK